MSSTADDPIMFFFPSTFPNSQFCKTFNNLKDSFLLVISGKGDESISEQVGTRLFDLVQDAIPLIFGVLANLFSLGSVPDKLRKLLKNVRETAQKPLKIVAEKVGGVIKAALDTETCEAQRERSSCHMKCFRLHQGCFRGVMM